MAYNLLRPFKVITNGNMASSLTSEVVEIQQQDNISVQLKWTGTPTGTFEFQVSNNYLKDPIGNVQNPGDWITLAVTPAITASGSPDDALVDLNQMGSSFLRVVFTRSGGTGVLNVWVTGKGI